MFPPGEMKTLPRLMVLAWVAGLAVVITGCASSPDHQTVKTPYQYPLVSPGVQFATLPPVVQNTIRAQAGASSITHISQGYASGVSYYKVSFEKPLIEPPLFVASDGSVLEPNLETIAVGAGSDLSGVDQGAASNISLADLPAPVLNALVERAPDAEIGSIHKEVWGERDLFIVTFSDSMRYPKLYILSDGTLATGGSR